MEARMKFKTGWLAAAAFAALALASPATAHHTADNLNFDSTVEVTGTVKEFQWTSPYTMLALEVEGEGGAAEEWLIDMNSPGMLMRRGWSDGDVGKLAGNNLLRAMEGAEKVATAMARQAPETGSIGSVDTAAPAG